MKRAIVLASGAAIAMALATPSLADEQGKLIFIDVTQSAYISDKNVRIIPAEETNEPGSKTEPTKTEPKVITVLSTDTYEVGTRVWERPSGLCYMEKRTLESIQELSGIQLPNIRVQSGSANCETREFLDGSNFSS